MRSRLADHLRAARRRHFVGRTEGKALFQEAIEAEEPEFFVLYVYGPGGLGKTSLLHEFDHLAQQAACHVAYLDGRNVEPTPEAFQHALHTALGFDPATLLLDCLAGRAGTQRVVILLDTYEHLMPLDDWLRDVFLPQMPENVFFVLAGRDEPASGWRSDPGWQELLRTLPLRYLSAEESLEFLQRRGVPENQQAAIIQFTHGYPLALSLVADVFDQQPDYQFQPEAAVDLITLLVSHLLDEVPGPAHRATLDLCCLARGTTEAHIAEILKTPDAHELFRWLRSLSFIDSGPRGLFPHDLAREVLHAELRWRNPDWYAELHKRARSYYTERIRESQGQEQQRALFDLIYLHRENPMVKPFFEWRTAAATVPDRMVESDLPALTAMVAKHEGDASAAIAAHWLARQPENVLVLRNTRGRPLGFLAMVGLHAVTPADQAIDPAVRAARTYLDRHAPLRVGEVATLFRFWLGDQEYQAVSPSQSILFTNMVRHYLTTPKLAFTFLPCADPDFWRMAFEYADLARLPAADFTVGGRSYGVYGHDWRVTPPVAWLTLLGDRELGAAVGQPQASHTLTLVVLSAEDFAEAAKQALQNLSRADVLRASPLLWSKLVADHVDPQAETAERTAVLQKHLMAAVETLRHAPRDLKLYRAVYHTYIQPAPTQELAAELLDVPFSSYRRHLKEGIQRVAQQLWRLETGAS
ncbi:MAG TPA: ATP-binding protein [Caldilineaceae bacterium]|nr:ATP-binding protein [Caldilineaceae bacterium]